MNPERCRACLVSSKVRWNLVVVAFASCALLRVPALAADATRAPSEPPPPLSSEDFELSAAGLFSQAGGAYGYYGGGHYHISPVFRFDITMGALVPFEDSGMAFGNDTTAESFDAGFFTGMRFGGELAERLFLGFEFDFAIHRKSTGEVLFEGDLSRLYFMLPVSYEVPLGDASSPARLGFMVAPGLQVALPAIDPFFRDRQAILGRFLCEKDFVAFDLRAGMTFNYALGPYTIVFLEVSYDWAVGKARSEVRNFVGSVVERSEGYVDLGALNVMLGFSARF